MNLICVQQQQMSIELTQEQISILKELKAVDPDQNFKGIPDCIHSSSFLDDPQSKTATFDMFFDVDYDTEHEVLRDKLLNYRKKSQQIYRVGQLLKEYETKFSGLMQDKDKLIELLNNMKGSTSQIVQRQKKMINLSMKMKESLDYYSYHSKFSFDYPCEISCREMYQNILQQTLSELTDGIQFFQENTTYSQAKKYLSMFQNSRSKMLSFVKSFFIKLFNKESTFMNKHMKISFNNLLQNFYPKSKLKFISTFLVFYPQFASNLENILKSIKETATEDELKFIEMKQNQIYQFQLTQTNHSLIGYLQNYMPEIYEEGIHHFFTYYRTNFHQNYIKNAVKRQGNLPEVFNQKYLQCIYILTNQYAYMCFCCRANNYDKAELIRTSIVSLAKTYFEDLARMVKDFRNKNAFQLCDIIMRIKEDYPVFLERHMGQQYESYAFGCVSQYINDPQHIEFLISLFNSYSNKFLSELQVLCFNSLPKFEIKNSKEQVQKAITQFLLSIPKLKLCEQYAQKFLIGALDAIVKSIKDVNSKIESRFECYLWNIEMFSTIRNALKGVRGNLIRKQLKFDVNNSSNLLQRMKGVDRNESILKYAQQIFNVLKTGMPVINELTLDFNKYINEHCDALQSQFVKDILYIYAKNMIQFLQRLSEAEKGGEEASKEVCQGLKVKSLYSSYLINLQKYLRDAKILLKEREQYKFSEENSEIILKLMDIVYEKLFDFLDKFYVKVSEHVNESQSFNQIQMLKKMYQKSW